MYWFAQSVFKEKPATAAAGSTPLIGKWSSTINTQIGNQEYVYSIESKDDKLSGTAAMKLDGTSYSSTLVNVKLDGKSVSFEEQLKFGDREILITYTGELNNDEIQFTRKVGDFATEKFVAKRVK